MATLLNEGASARVYAFDDGERRIAIKVFRSGREIDALREKKAYEAVGPHNHIIQYISCHKDAKHGNMAIKLEYASLCLIDMERGSYPMEKVVSDVAKGVHHIHSKRVAHLDLKPDNIMCVEKDGEFTFKLADFGAAYVYEEGEELRSIKTRGGSFHYIAPEIWVPFEPYDGMSADMWAFGIIVFSLIVGHFPFQEGAVQRMHCTPGLDSISLISVVLDEAKTGLFSAEQLAICEGCIRVTPSMRLTSSDVINMI